MKTMQSPIRTRRQLAEVETLALTLEAVQRDLTAYRAALSRQLDFLHHPEGLPPVDAGIGKVVLKLFRSEPPAPSVPPPLTAAAERRTSRRRIGNPISIVIADEVAESEPMAGWVMDRSSTGLGLWVDEEEPVGTLLRVRPVKSEEADWWTEVVVRHCRAERGRYVVGCQFVKEVPWSRLRMFG